MGEVKIDFEDIPLKTPKEGMNIRKQFSDFSGVKFSQLDGSAATLAEVGAPGTAFTSTISSWGDTPLGPDAADIGQFFLTDDGSLTGLEAGLVMRLDVGASSVDGVLLDVDYDEDWAITAYNRRGHVVDTAQITAGDLDTGDGQLTKFSLAEANERDNIFRIEFTADRSAAGYFGFALDNLVINRTAEHSAGTDRLSGSDGNDLIRGLAGNDKIFGFAGNDKLVGNRGRDILIDGFDTDRLKGGGGADTFVLVRDRARDIIRDYKDGVDQIDLSDFRRDFSDLKIADLPNGNIRIKVAGEALILKDADDAITASDLTESDFLF